MTSPLNQIFMNLATRAERYDPSTLANTFVDVGPLFTFLSSTDHQIVYGRRGTGKTHALHYLAEAVRNRGDLPVYIDMRTIGSTGGIHADPNLPIAERGTRLLADTLAAIHDQLVDYVLREAEGSELDYSQALPALDSMAEALTEVKVVGTLDREARLSDVRQVGGSVGIGAGFGPGGVRIQGYARSEQRASCETETRMVESGVPRHRVHFGAVTGILTRLLNALPEARLWVLIDEWSDIPTDLQPLLADFLKRSLFPIRDVTVKIGAIEHRSRFRVPTDAGGYLGIELGADASANVDLDDFMVFSNDIRKAETFSATSSPGTSCSDRTVTSCGRFPR